METSTLKKISGLRGRHSERNFTSTWKSCLYSHISLTIHFNVRFTPKANCCHWPGIFRWRLLANHCKASNHLESALGRGVSLLIAVVCSHLNVIIYSILSGCTLRFASRDIRQHKSWSTLHSLPLAAAIQAFSSPVDSLQSFNNESVLKAPLRDLENNYTFTREKSTFADELLKVPIDSYIAKMDPIQFKWLRLATPRSRYGSNMQVKKSYR